MSVSLDWFEDFLVFSSVNEIFLRERAALVGLDTFNISTMKLFCFSFQTTNLSDYERRRLGWVGNRLTDGILCPCVTIDDTIHSSVVRYQNGIEPRCWGRLRKKSRLTEFETCSLAPISDLDNSIAPPFSWWLFLSIIRTIAVDYMKSLELHPTIPTGWLVGGSATTISPRGTNLAFIYLIDGIEDILASMEVFDPNEHFERT